MKTKEFSKMDCLVLGFFIGVIVGCLLQILPAVIPAPSTGMFQICQNL